MNHISVGTRNLSRQSGISQTSVHRVIRRNLLHPYHIEKMQELLPEDLVKRVTFCQFILHQDIHFQKKILFTLTLLDCFTRRGITNLQNYHDYSYVNPHSVTPRHFQREFKINVWIVILPNRLNGETYLEFLQNPLPDLLDEVPLQLRLEHWFMHDGAPPHFRNNCPQVWPPRSPDLNKCDFFLWGKLKEFVYFSPVASRAELWNPITDKCNVIRNNQRLLERVDFSFRRRINLCLNILNNFYN
ncbi:hypothetical protein NQ318_003657, partial [Aromia moschata]